MPKLLGVLGGMGPAATADFLNKLVRTTPALKDDDHIPTLIASIPQIPDRTEAILHQATSPLPDLYSALSSLLRGGADCIAIPCNTAHYWYNQLFDGTVEAIHIVDAVVRVLDRSAVELTDVGLLATPATISAKVYPNRAPARYRFVEPSQQDLDRLIMPSIRAVKAGDLASAIPLIEEAAGRLFSAGAQRIVLACTELPLVLDSRLDGRFIDATQALVDACLDRFGRGRKGEMEPHFR